jgi:hypothetical protein
MEQDQKVVVLMDEVMDHVDEEPPDITAEDFLDFIEVDAAVEGVVSGGQDPLSTQ